MGFIQICLSIVFFKSQTNQDLLSSIDNILEIISEKTQDSHDKFSFEDLCVLKREIMLTARVSGNYILVADINGKIVIEYRVDESSSEPVFVRTNEKVPRYILQDIKTQGIYLEKTKFGTIIPSMSFVAAKPIYDKDALTGYVFAVRDAMVLQSFLANMLSTFVLSAVLVLIFSSVISIWLSSHTTTHLRQLTKAVQRFGTGDFTQRVPEKGDQELVAVAVQFNEMARSLQQIDVSRRSFMGNIAHEIRTPITSIKGFIDGLIDGTIPAEQSQHYLEIASKEAGRLSRLVTNMLDITKLEAGEYQLKAVSYDICETLTNIIFSCQQRIQEKKIVIHNVTPVQTMVYADPDFVHQVLYNLVDNALKFTPEGGEISFAVRKNQPFGMVTIIVKNTGAGIPKELRKYVFDRFYTEDQSRGLNTSGSGLGLHICKVLVGLSGGQIWVESKENEYTAFLFTLPIYEEN